MAILERSPTAQVNIFTERLPAWIDIALYINLLLQPQTEEFASLLQLVTDIVCNALGIQHVDIDHPLGDKGVDSMYSIAIRNTLARTLNIELPQSLLFTYPTISKLASYLLKLKYPSDKLDMPKVQLPPMRREQGEGGGGGTPPIHNLTS